MKYLQTLFKNLTHPAGLIGAVVALAIPFFIYLGPNVGAKDVIRTLDLRMPLPLFLVQLALGILLFGLLFKDFRQYFKEKLPPKPYIFLVGIFALGATLFAGSQIEARHRVQSDESVFMAIAQNMYFNQTTGTCDEGEFEKGKLNCFKDSDSFKTKGLSFLYLLGMPFFGPDLHWIFHCELAMLFFAALLLFFAIRAWTSDDLMSALTSILLFAQPTVLFQFRSMSVEPLYIFLSALSLWVLKWAFDRNTLRHWILCADPPGNGFLFSRLPRRRPAEDSRQKGFESPGVLCHTFAFFRSNPDYNQLLPRLRFPRRAVLRPRPLH